MLSVYVQEELKWDHQLEAILKPSNNSETLLSWEILILLQSLNLWIQASGSEMKDYLFYEASRAIFSYFINLMLKSKEGVLFASKPNNMFMPDLQHFIFTGHLSVDGLPFSHRFPCHFITSSLDHGVKTSGFTLCSIPVWLAECPYLYCMVRNNDGWDQRLAKK